MKQQTFILILTTEILVAAGYFLWRTYLHRELPRTVENLTGEWLLKHEHVWTIYRGKEDEWSRDFPLPEHDAHTTLLFDAGYGCIEIEHEDDLFFHVDYYRWELSGDTLMTRDDEMRYVTKYRIEKLTRTNLILLDRSEGPYGKHEWTSYYERIF